MSNIFHAGNGKKDKKQLLLNDEPLSSNTVPESAQESAAYPEDFHNK